MIVEFCIFLSFLSVCKKNNLRGGGGHDVIFEGEAVA